MSRDCRLPRNWGRSSARQQEICRFPVTVAALLLSKLYVRASRDSTPHSGWTAPGTRPEDRAGGEEEEASNKPATGLQLACNLLATMAQPRHCYGVVPLPSRAVSAFRKVNDRTPALSRLGQCGGTGKNPPCPVTLRSPAILICRPSLVTRTRPTRRRLSAGARHRQLRAGRRTSCRRGRGIGARRAAACERPNR
jgi:hypothetical protein